MFVTELIEVGPALRDVAAQVLATVREMADLCRVYRKRNLVGPEQGRTEIGVV